MRNITIKAKAYFFLFLFLATVQLASGQYCNLHKKCYEYWRSKLACSLGLDANQFQLSQLNEPVGNTSHWLWHIFDAIPAHADGLYYNPSQHNSFSSDYGLLLYQSKIPGTDTTCDLNDAMLTYIDANHQYVWNKTIDDLLLELGKSQELTISWDTTFTDCADSCGTIKIKIGAHFNHVVVFYAYPYSTTNTATAKIYLYKPWFTTCYLNSAYNNVGYSVLSTENWENAFGPNGYMQAVCKAIIIADSGNIDMYISNNKMKFSTNTYFENDPIMLGVLVSSIKDYIQLLQYLH